MPRGRKKYSLDEKMENVINEISKSTQELKALKEKKKDLEYKLKNQQLSDLHSLIEESGMSIDEVKTMIDNQ